MTKEITMPRLSETMPDGKIVVWYKKPDDEVKKGEVIAEVETDKANMEIEAVDSGILSEILVPEGGVAKVGEPIAILDGKKPPERERKQEFKEPEKAEEPHNTDSPPEKPQKHRQEKTSEGRASIIIRQLAEQSGVDLSKVKGTGPDGQIKKSDVLMAADKKETIEEIQPEDTVTGKEQPLSRIRQTIAKRMTYSKQHIPHFYVTVEVNAVGLTDYYGEIRQKIDGITYNDIFIKAIALVLKQHPRINASFKGDHISLKHEINIGMAFATENGLLVPVVHSADQLDLRQIHSATASIKDRVKNSKLKPEDMSGGTFTISNLGMYGVKSFMAIINPPEAAGLAIGTIMDGRVSITLSGDHRVVDGADGALFMKDLKGILERPQEIEQV